MKGPPNIKKTPHKKQKEPLKIPRARIESIANAFSTSYFINQRQSASLVNLEAAELPISCAEARCIIPHKRLASTGAAALGFVVLVRTSPITAQIDVGNDTLVFEMGPDVTIRVWEICKSCAPSRWVRTPRGDIRRDFRPCPLPYSDSSIAKLHCIYLKGRVYQSSAFICTALVFQDLLRRRCC